MQYGPFGKSAKTAKTVLVAAVVVPVVWAKSIAISKLEFADALP